MGFLKRVAFYMGMMLGLTTIAAAGTVALTYLLTGKLASVKMIDEKPEITLMTPDEVVIMVREQADKIKSAGQAVEEEGGGGDE